MNKNRNIKAVYLLLSLSLVIACSKNNELANQSSQNIKAVQNVQPVRDSRSLMVNDSVEAEVTVFASNIAFPRGLKFGPDGYLYVALAGFGGVDSTSGKCVQVIPPVGPYKGGNTSKIIKISKGGTVSTVADSLPSDINVPGFTSGVADVEFLGDDLYALLVAGCSHGNNVPSSVIKVNRTNGSWSVIADLSTYFLNNKVAVPEPDDFEPDGTPYSLINVGGNFYAIEPNHGEMVKITTDGNISRVIDFSAHFGHIVPTAVTFHDDFFVGNLRTFPLVEGSSSIYKVTPDGQVEVWATGFTGILGVAFDDEHRLYVLETSAGGGPTPNTGRVVRINKDDSRDVIIDKLNFPTAMTFGPDEALYISNTGFGPPTGQILKVVLKDDDDKRDRNHHHDRDRFHHDDHDRNHHE
jgi:sugar lactone lactonase YvrE